MLVYSFYLICGSLCCYIACMFLLPNKLLLGQKITIFAYILLVSCFLEQYIGQMISLVSVTGIMLLLTVFTHGDLLCLICSLTGYLYAVAFNYLFQWAFNSVFHVSTENWFSHEKLAIGFSVFYCFFCGVTTKLLGNFLHLRLKENELLHERRLMSGLFAYLVVLTSLFILNISYGGALGYSYGVIALSGIIFLSLFLLTVFLLLEIYEKALQIQQKKSQLAQFENLQLYTKKIEESYGAMRRFKHDYLNILTTLELFIKEGDLQGLKEYYFNKILSARHGLAASDTKLESLSRIGNTELKSLVSSKLIYSMELGIHTDIEVKEPVGELFIDSLDLARVLGIFLDNAIEAALETDEKGLRFCMVYTDDVLKVIIQNTSKPLTVSIYDLNQQGISGKGENRGIGLFNAEKLLAGYSNVVWDTVYEKPWFSQRLMITRCN